MRDRQLRKQAAKYATNEYCDSCKEGGDLLCCDRCSAAFHLQCQSVDSPSVLIIVKTEPELLASL